MIVFYWGEYENRWETTSNNFSSHPLHLWPRTKSQPLILSMTADQEILFCKPCRRLTPEVVVVVVVHVSNIPKHHPTTRGINGLIESCESQFLQKVNGQQPQSGIPWTFKSLDIWKVTSHKRQRSWWNLITNNHRISMDIMGVHRLVFKHGNRENPPTSHGINGGLLRWQNHRTNSRGDVQGHRAQVVWHLPYPREDFTRPWQDMLHLATSHLTRCFVTHVEDSPQPIFWRPRRSPFVPVGQRLFLKGKPKKSMQTAASFSWKWWSLRQFVDTEMKFNEIDVDGYMPLRCLVHSEIHSQTLLAFGALLVHANVLVVGTSRVPVSGNMANHDFPLELCP